VDRRGLTVPRGERRGQGWPRWWAWLALPVLVTGLYARVLSLPLYWDDARHYGIVRAHTLLEIWLNQTRYGYYRPALFTFYKFAFSYLTPELTFLCYGVAVVLHALSSVLAGKLVTTFLQYLRPARPAAVSPLAAGFIAAVLFAAYPFTLFAIGNFAALMHPFVTFFALAGVFSTLKLAQTRRRRWLWGMLLCAGLAPWFHESGVVLAAILLAETVILDWRLAWRHKWSLAGVVAAAGLFAVVWWLVPKTRTETAVQDLKTMADNLAFFVQGLTYPLQPLATLLIGRLGWPEIPSVWVVAVPSLLALGVLLWRSGQRRVFFFGLVWFLLGCAPSVVMLPYWYINPSPRLLYYIGPAAILLWTLGLVALAGYVPGRRARALVAPGLALAALAVPLIFTVGKQSLFEVSLAHLKQLAALAHTYPDDTHLVVNPPNWVADVQDLYPLGRWGVSIAPDYVLLSELVTMNAGRPSKFDGVHFPPVRMTMEGHNWAVYRENEPADWGQLAADALSHDHVWVITYARDQIAVEEGGTIRSGSPVPPGRFLASFENKVYLVGATHATEGAVVTLTLAWKYLGPDPNATVFRHVLDCAGQPVGSGDGHPLDRLVPFGFLPAGADVRDVRRIVLDAPPADGCTAFEIGLFRPDGSRVPALAPDGTEFPNDAVPVH
jgi:hypothetical protein